MPTATAASAGMPAGFVAAAMARTVGLDREALRGEIKHLVEYHMEERARWVGGCCAPLAGGRVGWRAAAAAPDHCWRQLLLATAAGWSEVLNLLPCCRWAREMEMVATRCDLRCLCYWWCWKQHTFMVVQARRASSSSYS